MGKAWIIPHDSLFSGHTVKVCMLGEVETNLGSHCLKDDHREVSKMVKSYLSVLLVTERFDLAQSERGYAGFYD